MRVAAGRRGARRSRVLHALQAVVATVQADSSGTVAQDGPSSLPVPRTLACNRPFLAMASACTDCTLRTRCLRKPGTTPLRQVAMLTRKAFVTHTQRMRERIDSDDGELQPQRLTREARPGLPVRPLDGRARPAPTNEWPQSCREATAGQPSAVGRGCRDSAPGFAVTTARSLRIPPCGEAVRARGRR